MTAKQFFKSTSFKCIISLLCILLVCGIFLTVAYGFLEVTDGERLQRAVNKIYSGIDVATYGLDENGNEILIDEKVKEPKSLISQSVTVGKAEIQDVYKVVYDKDGEEVTDYLVTSKGSGGYGGGSVTCRVAVSVKDNSVTGIYKVIVESNSGQSFIGKITDSFLTSFSTDYEQDIYYSTSDGYLSTGATLSSTAICNAVNGALEYVQTEVLGLESEDPLAGFAFTEYIETKLTTYTVGEGGVTYNIVTSGFENATAFTVTIVVGSDKKISSYEIVSSGSTADRFDQKVNVSLYEGKDADYFKGIIGENGENTSNGNYEENGIQTGATYSNYLCLYAALFATANYDNCLAAQGGN